MKLKVKEANTEAEEAQAQLLEAQKELASARDNVWAAEDRIGVLNALLGEAQSQKDAAELEVRRLRDLIKRNVSEPYVLRVNGGYSFGTPSLQCQLGVGVTHDFARNTRMYRPSFSIQINPPPPSWKIWRVPAWPGNT